MADLIDRQAAIDEIDSYEVNAPDYMQAWAAKLIEAIKGDIRGLISELPSAQPTQTNKSNALKSLDCISRQAVIDALNKHSVMFGFHLPHEFHEVKEEIRGLPSAQRTGRWIVVSDGYGNGEATACICECSECKDTIWVYKKSDRKWNYCPNCGSRMEEPSDE